ncbi:hypothetical protein quinque_016034 [Culex quinquefasciatus]
MTKLVLVALVILLIKDGFSVGAANECRKLDPCRCEFDDGRGYDLGQVVEKNYNYLETVDPATGDHYLFHPCADVRYLPQNATADNECARGDGYANLLLFSPYACPVTIEEISHSGIGKVLLILLFVGSFTYFAIGSIVRFMYLGARGIEVIPNLGFWKDLPGLVRDGARFLQNGCRVERAAPDPDSYDAI